MCRKQSLVFNANAFSPEGALTNQPRLERSGGLGNDASTRRFEIVLAHWDAEVQDVTAQPAAGQNK